MFRIVRNTEGWLLLCLNYRLLVDLISYPVPPPPVNRLRMKRPANPPGLEWQSVLIMSSSIVQGIPCRDHDTRVDQPPKPTRTTGAAPLASAWYPPFIGMSRLSSETKKYLTLSQHFKYRNNSEVRSKSLQVCWIKLPYCQLIIAHSTDHSVIAKRRFKIVIFSRSKLWKRCYLQLRTYRKHQNNSQCQQDQIPENCHDGFAVFCVAERIPPRQLRSDEFAMLPWTSSIQDKDALR